MILPLRSNSHSAKKVEITYTYTSALEAGNAMEEISAACEDFAKNSKDVSMVHTLHNNRNGTYGIHVVIKRYGDS